MKTSGMLVLSALVNEGLVKGYLGSGLKDHWLSGDELEVHDFITEHLGTHGTIPQAETILAECHIKLPQAKEPSTYYLKRLRDRYLSNQLRDGLQSVSGKLVPDPNGALDTLLGLVLNLSLEGQGSMVLDYREARDRIMAGIQMLQADSDESGVEMGWPSLDKLSGGLVAGDMMSVVGRPGLGKAQPLDSIIHTCTGTKYMRDIKEGDSILSVDGKPSAVSGVFPQGILQTYEFIFRDGRKAEASGDHLWEVMYRDWKTPRVLTTDGIMEMLQRKRYRNRLSVQLISGDFGTRYQGPLTPWLLGLLLGDGGFTGGTPMFSTDDMDIVHRVEQDLPRFHTTVYRSGYDYAISQCKGDGKAGNDVKKALSDWNLWGSKSESKFIPEEFYITSREDRLDLLRGLMDSDGWVQAPRSPMFATASEQLAKDVQRLVYSLGGMCTRNFKKNDHKGAWVLSIMMNDPSEVFWLSRKKVTMEGAKIRNRRLTICDIQPKRKTHCQCIMVDHPSRLYVTNDYTVTHNTFMMLYSAYHIWKEQRRPVLFVTLEMTPALIEQRIAAIDSSVNVKAIKTGVITTTQKDKLLKVLDANLEDDVPFYVVDGAMTATSKDIAKLVRQLQPGAVFVDGAYLLKHDNKRLNKYDRVAETTEHIKWHIATELKVPCVCSYQLSREAAKKIKKSKTDGALEVDLEDIAMSDAIGQLSSIVIGLFEEEGVETKVRRMVNIMKGRSGEVGSFLINWDFKGMDFKEDIEDQPMEAPEPTDTDLEEIDSGKQASFQGKKMEFTG